jgi:hypothetical protein
MPQRNPVREQEIYQHLAGTPFGIMDWAVPIGGVEATRAFADELARREIPWGLCLRDMYPDELGAWGGFPRRAAGFPGLSREQIVRTMVQTFRDHPALRFYYVNDEMGTEYTHLLRELRQWVHQEDPTHPCLASYHDFEPVGALARGSDIIAPELYAWRHSDEPLQMADMMAQVSGRVPESMMTWANLIWLADSYPLYKERFRAGAWIALARGCRGVLIDGVPRIHTEEEWRWLKAFGEELQTLSPLLLQPAGPTCPSTNPGMVTGTFAGPQGLWLAVVNGTRVGSDTSITLPPGTRGASEAGHARSVRNTTLRLHLRPYGVRLFRLS